MSRELVLVAGRPRDLPGCAESANPQLSCCPLPPLARWRAQNKKRAAREEVTIAVRMIPTSHEGRPPAGDGPFHGIRAICSAAAAKTHSPRMS
jgi:hypothetical protein